MAELFLNSSITHSLLLVLPLICAALLRKARCPGWAVVGGAVAGILLGPSVLGRIAPTEFERHFVGGVEEREARDAIVSRHAADLLVAREAGLDAEAFKSMRMQHDAERAEADAVLAEARWGFQRPFRSYTAAMAVLCLLASGVLRTAASAARHPWTATVGIGLWSALVPAALAYAAGTRWFGMPTTEALALGAAVGIGPWAIQRGDRASADDAELGGAHMLQTAGRVATAVSLAIAAIAAGLALGWPRGLWVLPLAAAPLGWMLPALPEDEASRRWTDMARTGIELAVLPSVAACAVLRTELQLDARFWLILVIVVLSGDGRWLGAFLGGIAAGGRRGPRTMRLVLGAMAAGPMQLSVAAVAVHAGLIDGSAALALVAGALIVELTARTRRKVGQSIAEAEAEAERLE